ncbi:MAG: hypothetical protein R3C28_24855 [Pirellulaceae bacterium]
MAGKYQRGHGADAAHLPDIAEVIPGFRSLKVTADGAELVGVDSLELSTRAASAQVNDGAPWPNDLGVPVIDWQASFPAEETDADGDGKIDPAGLELPTVSTPVYIDFDGTIVTRHRCIDAHLQLAEFVHVSGNFAFVKGPSITVDVQTNFPSDAVTLLETVSELVPTPIMEFMAEELAGQDGPDRCWKTCRHPRCRLV